jgi:membrane-associated phospholipid phosphatase
MSKARTRRAPTAIERADLQIAKTVALKDRSFPGRALSAVAELGDQPPLLGLCGLTIGAGLMGRNRKLVRTGIRMLAAHMVATAIKGFIKDEVDRGRPGAAGTGYKLSKGRSKQGRLRSMPSGHSAGLTAVARAVSREYPGVAPAAAAGSAGLALAQLPSKNHFASDVVAGVAIGWLSDAIVAKAMGPESASGPQRT